VVLSSILLHPRSCSLRQPEGASDHSNGGSDTDHDIGNDTEEEDNSELEQYYLAKTEYGDRDIGTVLGNDIGVW
jgi:hypothetical protein